MQGQGMENMQIPGTPTMGNMASRTATGMAGAGQMGNNMGNMPNLASLNPQQRQLVLMQMQMRHANGNMAAHGQAGMAGTNPQIALQERQRLELQQQQTRMLAQRQGQGSPLNPNAAAAMGAPDQFSPGSMQRSNSNANISISQSSRSPSVGDASAMGVPGTPRVSGQMLGTQEYQRQMLAAQRQMQQQAMQQGLAGGQGQGAWPGQQPQQPQQQQQMPMSAGAWPQQGQQFGMGGNMASGGNNLMGIPDRSSATPAPMGQQSPTVQQTSANDFSDLMKW